MLLSLPLMSFFLLRYMVSLQTRFGCACFLYFVTTCINKVSPRSIKCVFLGYAPHYEDYRCLDPLTNHVYISHHVRFHETEFYYSSLVPWAPFVNKFTSFILDDVLSLTYTIDVIVTIPTPSTTSLFASHSYGFTSQPSGPKKLGPVVATSQPASLPRPVPSSSLAVSMVSPSKMASPLHLIMDVASLWSPCLVARWLAQMTIILLPYPPSPS